MHAHAHTHICICTHTVYINHRPAFGLSPIDLLQAFSTLGDGPGCTVDRGTLLALLQENGMEKIHATKQVYMYVCHTLCRHKYSGLLYCYCICFSSQAGVHVHVCMPIYTLPAQVYTVVSCTVTAYVSLSCISIVSTGKLLQCMYNKRITASCFLFR